MNRSPGFCVATRGHERCRHHTDNCVDIATERDGLPHDLRIAIELFGPQFVAQNYHKRSANLIVLRGNVATHLRLHTKRFKKTTGHLPDLELNGFRASSVCQWLHHNPTKS